MHRRERLLNFASATEHARMAESVDAPVSNTGGAIHLGSSPSPGTRKRFEHQFKALFLCVYVALIVASRYSGSAVKKFTPVMGTPFAVFGAQLD